MDIILSLACLTFAIGIAIEKATQFIKNLKDDGSAKMKNGFQVSLSIEPIDKKREHVQPTQNSNFNNNER